MQDEHAEKVTLKDVYAVVARLEDKIDTRYTVLEKDLKEVSERVDKLEQWRWYIMGSLAVVIGMAWYFANEIKRAVVTQ